MKKCILRLCVVCNTTQPVRAKVRYNSAKSQQPATSSTSVMMKNDEKKFAVCDSFVEFMIRKHQEELQRLSALIREEAIQRYNSYMQYDARVVLLNMWAQKWLESQRLKDSKHGLFSTYHVLMLVLHFLQCTGSYGIQPVLPVMCKKFRGNLRPTLPIHRVALSLYEKPKSLNFQEKQEPDVAELILLFVSHYAKYDFNQISFHLHNATVTERNQFGNEYEQHQVSIFDPYASTTVCRVKGGADLLTNAFQITKRAMLAGYCLNWPISMK
ncbi:hypothetical protein X798_05064 [Onchocerca flexuosa]|uniref:PAP-associated domain-containing protein n=1 Tax=Onchocerca flexuosa TaxID=387005 RepID=A0A238BRG6_9BILA|nr:hypothetical protein X798_05064 [Onchocerca flexuosa]